MEFAGLRTTSWVTDTGDVVREESPLGLMTVRESPENARAMAVSSQVQTDLLEAAAIVPVTKERIDEPRDVRRLRIRLEGADLSGDDLDGGAQTFAGNVVEIRDPRSLRAGPADPDARSATSRPEPLIESDDPDIRAEAAIAVRGVTGTRARAERLTRYVNGLLEKKPTVSIPSAREVLRTKVGDCNEHTALYVAMARALGHSRAHRRRPRVRARRVLLPRVARGVHRRRRRPRALAAGRSRRSTSSRPTPRTCASRAAASTSRR